MSETRGPTAVTLLTPTRETCSGSAKISERALTSAVRREWTTASGFCARRRCREASKFDKVYDNAKRSRKLMNMPRRERLFRENTDGINALMLGMQIIDHRE